MHFSRPITMRQLHPPAIGHARPPTRALRGRAVEKQKRSRRRQRTELEQQWPASPAVHLFPTPLPLHALIPVRPDSSRAAQSALPWHPPHGRWLLLDHPLASIPAENNMLEPLLSIHTTPSPSGAARREGWMAWMGWRTRAVEPLLHCARPGGSPRMPPVRARPWQHQWETAHHGTRRIAGEDISPAICGVCICCICWSMPLPLVRG